MDGKLGRKGEEMMIQGHNCQLRQFNLNDTVWVRNYNVSRMWFQVLLYQGQDQFHMQFKSVRGSEASC